MSIILVGYDGTDISNKALNRAIELVKEKDSLIILTVIQTKTFKGFETFPVDVTIAEAQKIINEKISEIKQMLSAMEINIIGIVREGETADEILNISIELKCDLIVIGEKDITKVGRFALGSISEKVLKYATIPVLDVR